MLVESRVEYSVNNRFLVIDMIEMHNCYFNSMCIWVLFLTRPATNFMIDHEPLTAVVNIRKKSTTGRNQELDMEALGFKLQTQVE